MLTTQARLATDAWRKSAIAGSSILTAVVFTATTNSAVHTATSVPHFRPAVGRATRDCPDTGATFAKGTCLRASGRRWSRLHHAAVVARRMRLGKPSAVRSNGGAERLL